MSSEAEAIVNPASSAPPIVAAGSAAAFSEFSLEQAKLALRKVKDPDLNLNIVDLGLVYDVRVVANDVEVDMSLTSPGCPSGPEIMGASPSRARARPTCGWTGRSCSARRGGRDHVSKSG